MESIEAKVLEEVRYLNEGDLDGVCKCYRDDVVFADISDPEHPAVGMKAFRASMKDFFNGFSDLKVDITRMSCTADGTVCAAEYILSGTQNGEFAGLEPKGKNFHVQACSVYELKGDKFSRETIYWNMAGVLETLR